MSQYPDDFTGTNMDENATEADEPSDPIRIAVGHNMQTGMSRDEAWTKALIDSANEDSIMGMVRNIKKLSDEIL